MDDRELATRLDTIKYQLDLIIEQLKIQSEEEEKPEPKTIKPKKRQEEDE